MTGDYEYTLSSREVRALIKLHLKSTSMPSPEKLVSLATELKKAQEGERLASDRMSPHDPNCSAETEST